MKDSYYQKGIIHVLPLLLTITAIGVISFLLLTSTVPLGGLFGVLNPRPASQAATTIGTTWTNVTSNLAGMAAQCGNLSMVEAVPGSTAVIAGVADKGLWTTSNSGGSWTLLGTGSPSTNVANRPNWLAFDPNSSSTYWEAGIYEGPGVYKTTDSGNTFKALGNSHHNDYISVDFTDPNRQTLVAGGHEQSQTVWKSTDGGTTWTNIGLNLPSGFGDTTNPIVINSQTYIVNMDDRPPKQTGIFRTTDGGTTWTQVSNLGPRNIPLITQNGTIYWLTTSSSGEGLAKSTDAGQSWTLVGTGNGFTGDTRMTELPDGRIVAIAGNILKVSADGGSTWSQIGPIMPFTPKGVTYSPENKAFFVWYWNCNLTVPADAIARLDADFGFTVPNVVPMPVISYGKPAFASSATTGHTASLANNTNMDDEWIASSLPATLAYDLSSVPLAQRGRVTVVFYPTAIWGNPTDSPKDYTIEANAAASGGSAPTSGWTTLTTITGSDKPYREHVVNLLGYNWVRINVTTSQKGNSVGFNMDIHDSSQGTSDNWLFHGDMTMTGLTNQIGSFGPSFPDLIHASAPNFRPVEETLNSDTVTAKSCSDDVKTWIGPYPDVKFVGLALGTMEASTNGYAQSYYFDNLKSCVNQIIAAGKYPMVPHIPYGTKLPIPTQGIYINAAIDQVYADTPQVIKGPDLWTTFQGHPEYDPDGFHISGAGWTFIRQSWAQMALSSIYNGPSLPSLPILNPLPTGSVTKYPFFANYTDTNGTLWLGSNSGPFTYTGLTIANTKDPALYRHTLHGSTPYTLSVPNGDYNVTLKFAENEITSAGQRVFNVTINGTTVLSNFDILSQVAPHTALDKTFPATVTNGTIVIGMNGVVGSPSLAGIQAVPTGTITPTPSSSPTATPVPTPTPIPTPAPTPIVNGNSTTIDDSIAGTGANQLNYSGTGWSHCTNCGTNLYNGSNSWDPKTNDYLTLQFNGNQVVFYGVKDLVAGIGAISVDNGTETMIDFYASVRNGNQLMWTSPIFTTGIHTLKLRNTGTKNASSTGTYMIVDRVDVITSSSSCPKGPLGDTDCDGTIDIQDYNNVFTDFGKSGSGILGDVDKNGVVDIQDYNLIFTNFGK